jgi:hypothetical protein
LLYNLSQDYLKEMFCSLCSIYSGKFFGYGLEEPELVRLLNYSVTYLQKQGYDLHWHRPFKKRNFRSVNSFWHCIDEQIADARTTVIISLAEPTYHWTVAHQVTARTVKFFDSVGFGRYPFTSFTLNKAKAGDQPAQRKSCPPVCSDASSSNRNNT